MSGNEKKNPHLDIFVSMAQQPLRSAEDAESKYPVRSQGRRPWDRQPDEPANVFMVFLRYLALGLSRSVLKLHPQVGGVSQKQLMQVADRFQWVYRAEQYDAFNASMQQKALEKAQESKNVDIGRTVHTMALVASISAQRTLRQLQREKPSRVKRDSHGKPVLDANGHTVRERNPRYVSAERTVMELVTKTTELVKLLQNQPGTLSEVERVKSRDQLLSKLEKMADALSPKGNQSIGEPEALQVKRTEPEREPTEPGAIADALPILTVHGPSH